VECRATFCCHYICRFQYILNAIYIFIVFFYECSLNQFLFGKKTQEGLFPLLPRVVDLVSDSSIPVIAAGGIVDGRGYVAALALGAQGVCLGTRYYLGLLIHLYREVT
jgi:hypothetical protein